MVEIALATAVIAIGISSILVLFPIGINATRAAMEENCYSDAVDTVTAFVKSEFMKRWETETFGDYPTSEGNEQYNTTLQGFTDEVGTEKSGLKYSGKKGLYQFTRLGKDGEEIFSAEVKIWLQEKALQTGDTTPFFIPSVDDDSMKSESELYKSGGSESGLGIGDFAKSVWVEISWRDEVRTFRIDIYNPYFKIEPSA